MTDMINFNEQAKIDSVQGALALRGRINEVVDGICADGYVNICWLGIGGTWASSMQATVHMKQYSAIETWARMLPSTWQQGTSASARAPWSSPAR